jgi:hypothetical protein
MDSYRGNTEEVLRLTFPGALLEGEIPPPSFAQIDGVVKVLEGLTNRDLRYRAQLSNQFHFRLVGAKLGSLEVWIQLISISAGVVSLLSDAPGAIRFLMETLQNLKEGRGSARSLPQVTTASVPPDDREIAMIDQLRRSVKRAGSITIEHKDYSIILREVDFKDAERLPQPIRLAPAEVRVRRS